MSERAQNALYIYFYTLSTEQIVLDYKQDYWRKISSCILELFQETSGSTKTII